MAQQGNHPRGPGYTKAAGFGPNGEHPRTRPAATPPQFRQDSPRQDPYPTPQFSPRLGPRQSAFAPDPWQDSQPHGGYPPPQPTWQQPYQPQQPTWQRPYQPQPQYALRAPRQRSSHVVRNVIAGIGALIGVIIVISVAANSGHTVQTAGNTAGGTAEHGRAQKTAGIGTAITLAGNGSGEQMSVTVTKVISSASPATLSTGHPQATDCTRCSSGFLTRAARLTRTPRRTGPRSSTRPASRTSPAWRPWQNARASAVQRTSRAARQGSAAWCSKCPRRRRSRRCSSPSTQAWGRTPGSGASASASHRRPQLTGPSRATGATPPARCR